MKSQRNKKSIVVHDEETKQLPDPSFDEKAKKINYKNYFV